jgi:hypothetical protein
METGEDRFRSNPMSLWNVVTSQPCHGQGWRLWNPRTEAFVRATPIVMRYPLGQDLPQMPFIERNDVVETARIGRSMRAASRFITWDRTRAY